MEQEEKDQKPKVAEKGLIEEFVGDVISLERGLPATFLESLKNPGYVIDSYFEDKNRFVSPIKYTIFMIAVTSVIGNFVIDYEALMNAGVSSQATSNVEMDPMFTAFMNGVAEVSTALSTRFNHLATILVLAPLFAFASRLFFKKKRSTFKEHYIMTLYSLSTVSFINLAFLPMMINQANIWIYSGITSLSMFVFALYTQIKYLKLKGFDEYAQSFLSIMIGFILYLVGIFILQIGGAIILVIVRS